MKHRMTLTRAKRIMKNNNITLDPQYFISLKHRSACANGLYLVEKYGFDEAKAELDNYNMNGFIHALLGNDQEVVPALEEVKQIAEMAEVPLNYSLGLDKGFSGKWSRGDKYADTNSEDYKHGYDDGVALTALVNKKEKVTCG